MLDDAGCRELFGEMLARFREAPTPPVALSVEPVSRADLAATEAVPVAYGWTSRVMRTAEAALRLEAEGFATEASPLLRSMFEHVLALHWIDDQPSDAFQSLWRGWQRQLKAFRDAEAAGWELDHSMVVQIEDLLKVETDDSSRWVDNLLNIGPRAKRYGLEMLYRLWLIESWTSHACLASAMTYYDRDGDSAFTLRGDDPHAPPDVAPMCAAAGLGALEIYNRLLPGGPLAADMEDWRSRLGPTF